MYLILNHLNLSLALGHDINSSMETFNWAKLKFKSWPKKFKLNQRGIPFNKCGTLNPNYMLD